MKVSFVRITTKANARLRILKRETGASKTHLASLAVTEFFNRFNDKNKTRLEDK